MAHLDKKSGDWQLQTAKARFSELFDLARSVGPQFVTRRGRDTVVVVAAEEYARLVRRRRQRSLAALMAASPIKGLDLDFTRPREPERQPDL